MNTDPAHYSVANQRLQCALDELLAYMAPTPKQLQRVREITAEMAYNAHAIHFLYGHRT